MIKTKFFLPGLLACLLIACSSISSRKRYCGYELNGKEFIALQNKIKLQNSAYDADTVSEIYDQINDSIRNVIPDSIVFEVFMSLLNENEVGIDVFFPKNQAYFEKIACTVMNAKYKGEMPEQRYLCLYSYTNPDGSGDAKFEYAIKRKQ